MFGPGRNVGVTGTREQATGNDGNNSIARICHWYLLFCYRYDGYVGQRKMRLLIILILLSGCANKSYEFNPWTTVLNQVIKVNNNAKME